MVSSSSNTMFSPVIGIATFVLYLFYVRVWIYFWIVFCLLSCTSLLIHAALFLLNFDR